MKFFFADSQDFVDPDFDFDTEERSPGVRQRRDVYAHELFPSPPYDGVLISKAIVDGNSVSSGKYSIAQRNRLLNSGVRNFLRLDDREETKHLLTMGDCGAFSYMKEEVPPFSVEAVASFYDHCGFDWGVSVDHVIPVFDPSMDETLPIPGLGGEQERWRRRQEVTLELARSFAAVHRARRYQFAPVAVAQGWSGRSYAYAVRSLQKMGYKRIAIGGLVPLRTAEILEVVRACAKERRAGTSFHLLGVTRLEHIRRLRAYGVRSFDSTSPLRQAFMDDRDNYYGEARTYVAIRVPQVEGNARLKAKILAGAVDGRAARLLERKSLDTLQRYDRREVSLRATLRVLSDYAAVYEAKDDRSSDYEEVLADRPWASCTCCVCKSIGINVVIFRGAERNRRRGFHNLCRFYKNLQSEVRKRGVAQAK